MISETSITVKLTIAFAEFDTRLILVAPWCRKAFEEFFLAYEAIDPVVSFIAINTNKASVEYARQIRDEIEMISPEIVQQENTFFLESPSPIEPGSVSFTEGFRIKNDNSYINCPKITLKLP